MISKALSSPFSLSQRIEFYSNIMNQASELLADFASNDLSLTSSKFKADVIEIIVLSLSRIAHFAKDHFKSLFVDNWLNSMYKLDLLDLRTSRFINNSCGIGNDSPSLNLSLRGLFLLFDSTFPLPALLTPFLESNLLVYLLVILQILSEKYSSSNIYTMVDSVIRKILATSNPLCKDQIASFMFVSTHNSISINPLGEAAILESNLESLLLPLNVKRDNLHNIAFTDIPDASKSESNNGELIDILCTASSVSSNVDLDSFEKRLCEWTMLSSLRCGFFCRYLIESKSGDIANNNLLSNLFSFVLENYLSLEGSIGNKTDDSIVIFCYGVCVAQILEEVPFEKMFAKGIFPLQ